MKTSNCRFTSSLRWQRKTTCTLHTVLMLKKYVSFKFIFRITQTWSNLHVLLLVWCFSYFNCHWYQIFYKLYHLVKKKKIWNFTSYKKSSLDFTTNSITINASFLPNKVTKIPQKLQAASDCQPNGIRILIILQKAVYISHIFQITNT